MNSTNAVAVISQAVSPVLAITGVGVASCASANSGNSRKPSAAGTRILKTRIFHPLVGRPEAPRLHRSAAVRQRVVVSRPCPLGYGRFSNNGPQPEGQRAVAILSLIHI